MAKRMRRCAAILALIYIAGVTPAVGEYAWDGLYAGLNVGEARNNTCDSWQLNGPIIDPTLVAAFSNRACPNNSTFVGGLQIGYNFQYGRLTWGIGADYDYWHAQNLDRTLKYTGVVSPPGTYVLSGRLSPNGFGIIGPRIGFAGNHWQPYVRVGSVITGGSHNNTLSYTPAGATKPTASFSGGKDFTSTGWAAGGGIEFVLRGAWSIGAEYLHVNLGNGSNSTATCTGSPSACAAFAGVSLDSTHNSFTANVFRLGVNYWFGY